MLAPWRSEQPNRHFDLLGAVTVTLGLTALIYGLVAVEESGIGSARALLPLAAAVVLLAAFVLVESRSAHPLVPLRIFRLRAPTAANVIMLLFAAGVIAMNFFVTLYLQVVLRYSPVQAGLAFLPMALGQIVFSNVASRVIGRIGVRRTLIFGLTAATLAFLWFGAISPDGHYLTDVLGPAVLLSIAGGFTIVAMIVASISGVPRADTGLAGGLINMSQQVGGAVGLAALSTLAVWRTTGVGGRAGADAVALTAGFRFGFLVAAVLSLAAGVVAAFMLRHAFPAPAAAEQPVGPAEQPVGVKATPAPAS